MTPQTPVVARITAGPFATHSWILGCPRTRHAALIDASASWRDVEPVLREHELSLQLILLTHAHIDHILGLADVHERSGAPIYAHSLDRMFYEGAEMQAQMFGVPCAQPPPWHHDLDDLDSVPLGDLTLHTRFTPGHAPGHVVFHERAHRLLFGGDLLFAGSIGRTDLPGCDPAAMQASLRFLLTLDDDTAVHPGHTESTTIGRERRSNPFLARLRPA